MTTLALHLAVKRRTVPIGRSPSPLPLSRRARGIGGAGVDGAIADMDPVEGLT